MSVALLDIAVFPMYMAIFGIPILLLLLLVGVVLLVNYLIKKVRKKKPGKDESQPK